MKLPKRVSAIVRKLLKKVPVMYGVRIKWMSVARSRRERFRALISTDDNRKYFEDDFVEEIADRAAKLEKTYWKLLFFYTAIVAVLLVNLLHTNTEFTIFSLKISDIGKLKEALAFIAAALMFPMTMARADVDDLRSMLTVVVQSRTPRELWPFTQRRYDGIIGSLPPSVPLRRSWMLPTMAQKIWVVVFVAYIGIWLLALVPLSFALQMMIVHDLWSAPNMPPWSQLIATFYAIQLMGFFVFGFATKFPMPYRDYTLIMKLADLQKAHPASHARRTQQLIRIYRDRKLRKVRSASQPV